MSDLQTTDNVELSSPALFHQWNISMEDDESGVFNLAGTPTADLFVNVRIFWYLPRKPLTLVIETPYTKRKERFDVAFVDGSLGGMAKIYQIIDGEEIEKNGEDAEVSVSCDSNYQVVMKFLPSEMHLYGCNINYNLIHSGCGSN